MVTVIIFLSIMAVIGTVGYFTLRPIVLEHWDRWQTERRASDERQRRQQYQKRMQDQATTRVLDQLMQQEAETQHSGQRRRAA